MKIKTATTALFLLAVTAFMPACDLLARDCNPLVEECVFTGNHPGTLDPGRGK